MEEKQEKQDKQEKQEKQDEPESIPVKPMKISAYYNNVSYEVMIRPYSTISLLIYEIEILLDEHKEFDFCKTKILNCHGQICNEDQQVWQCILPYHCKIKKYIL